MKFFGKAETFKNCCFRKLVTHKWTSSGISLASCEGFEYALCNVPRALAVHGPDCIAAVCRLCHRGRQRVIILFYHRVCAYER